MAVYEAKTKPTSLSVSAYIADIEDPARRRDCRTLVALMKQATGSPARMWGTSIVGFGSYHYKYDSGHEGDSCIIGFSSRKSALSIYLLAGYEAKDTKQLLAQLGKHRVGKACLYVKQLADLELPILEQLIAHSVAYIRKRYPA